MTMNYKKMVEDIDKLVSTDECAEFEMKTMPHSKPFTQKEAERMVHLLGKIYLISHQLHCRACRKY